MLQDAKRDFYTRMEETIVHETGEGNAKMKGGENFQHDMDGESSTRGRRIKFSPKWEERIPHGRAGKKLCTRSEERILQKMRERRESYARFFFKGREERIIFGRGGEKITRERRRDANR
jgi:hypothetical protein